MPQLQQQVEIGANFCPNCGQDMNVVVPQDQRIPTEDAGVPPPPAPPEPGPRRGGAFRVIGIGCGGLIGLFILLAIIGSLIDDQDTSTVQKDEPAKEKKEEKPQDQEKKEEKKEEAAKQEPLQFSGSGPDTITGTLTQGVHTFTYTYQNEGRFSDNFVIRVLDSQGRQVDLAANAVVEPATPARGAKGVRIPRTGEYVVNVEADQGSWTLEITR
jgi:hypothetical protein